MSTPPSPEHLMERLPHSRDDQLWSPLGRALVKGAAALDLGRDATVECFAARAQLESIVRGCGYDLGVHIFGGVSILNLLEVGGDADFVGVGDCEPTSEEQGEIVLRLAREMRRVGLRASAIPKARVPVVKVDRVSHALPGTPISAAARSTVFQMAQPLSASQRQNLVAYLKDEWGAVNASWSNDQMAFVEFSDPTAAVAAIAGVTEFDGVAMPLRLPSDARNGPELFRYPFDLCFTTIGLRNSHLFHQHLAHYPYGRHFLMMVKRWARSSGVINSMGGLLCSYAVTVMALHYLALTDAIPMLKLKAVEPYALPKDPGYRALEGEQEADPAQLGKLFAGYFDYFAHVFDYDNDVVCTTTKLLRKTTIPNWAPPPLLGDVAPRPPFYHFCIKDPLNVDNIARNLTPQGVAYIREAHRLALTAITGELNSAEEAVARLTTRAPRPNQREPNVNTQGKAVAPPSPNQVNAASNTPDGNASLEIETKRMLVQERFKQRQTQVTKFGQSSALQAKQVKAAQDLTKSVVGWFSSAPER